MSKEIITYKAALLQSGKDFLEVNHLNKDDWLSMRWSMNAKAGEPVLENNSAPMAFSANINNPLDPLGYAIDITNLNVVHIPAGRIGIFTLQAGYINTMSLTLPLKPLSFDEMKAMAEIIARSFHDAGYILSRSKADMTEKSFGDNRRNKLDTYGQWRIPGKEGEFRFSLQVATYDSYSNIGITTPLSPALPKDAPRTYLFDFYAYVDGEVRKELSDLRYARRLAVNQNKDKPIPLKLWLDDPDWRPEGWDGKYI